MKAMIGLLFLTALVSCSVKKSNSEYIKFELRLAQSTPDSNLVEMMIYNSDEKFFVHDSVYLTNNNIDATEIIDWQTQPKIKVILNEEGKEKFSQFTGKYAGKNAAIVVNNQLISVPRINAQITKGVLLIAGFFDHEEAQSIAAGILPERQN